MDFKRGTDRRGATPPRVAARPDPTLWGEDELMSLAEAAHLFWPMGPLTERSLRTAVNDGDLPVKIVARKILTNRRAVQEMSKCAKRTLPETDRKVKPTPARRGPPRPDADEAYDRLMREIDGD